MPRCVCSQMIDAVVIGLSFAIDIFTLIFEERYNMQHECVSCLLLLCRIYEVRELHERTRSVGPRRRLLIELDVRSAHQATLTILLLLWRIIRLINGTLVAHSSRVSPSRVLREFSYSLVALSAVSDLHTSHATSHVSSLLLLAVRYFITCLCN